MVRIAVSRLVDAPHDGVWASLADLGSHHLWMRDAEGIVFTSGLRRGVGTLLRVRTAIGPLRVTDEMEVVGWEEGRSIEVIHTGAVTGRGLLAAEPHDDGTLVAWEETLIFPWYLGGPVAGWLAAPILHGLWRGNLERLEHVVKSR